MKHEVLALVRPVSWKDRYLLNPELYADAVTQDGRKQSEGERGCQLKIKSLFTYVKGKGGQGENHIWEGKFQEGKACAKAPRLECAWYAHRSAGRPCN